MQQHSPFADVLSVIEEGRFKQAKRLLLEKKHELLRFDGLLFATLNCEIDLISGDLSAARQTAERLLSETSVADIQAAAHKVLGEIHANQLRFEDSLAHFRAARKLCANEGSSTLSASVELSFWRWFFGVAPKESADADFARVRKAVARSGHPHHFVELRLCTARIEARKGALVEAQRHWEVARKSLLTSPNLKLESQLFLDGCMIALLDGDLRTALDYAR